MLYQTFKQGVVLLLTGSVIMGAHWLNAQESEGAAARTAGEKRQNESRISADEMEVDMKAGRAEFKGNVIISDATMTLSCDKMVVVFTKNQKISNVTGEGHVVIVEPENKRKATAEKALYDLQEGTITLTGDPVLEMADRKLYNAGSITYDLNSETVKTTRIPGSDKQPVIEFKTSGQKGFTLDSLTGGDGDDTKKPADDETREEND